MNLRVATYLRVSTTKYEQKFMGKRGNFILVVLFILVVSACSSTTIQSEYNVEQGQNKIYYEPEIVKLKEN